MTNSGYESVTKGFWNGGVFAGLWGQLFSPGKSVFLYSPPIVLALMGARRFWRHRPEAALAVALLVGPVVLLYSFYLFWSGDWAWGPRYLVFALPALLLPVARSLADLVCTEDFTHVKACEGPECTLLFVDRTRGRGRRWCSMAVCGNRAKQAAHRKRSRNARKRPK